MRVELLIDKTKRLPVGAVEALKEDVLTRLYPVTSLAAVHDVKSQILLSHNHLTKHCIRNQYNHEFRMEESPISDVSVMRLIGKGRNYLVGDLGQSMSGAVDVSTPSSASK